MEISYHFYLKIYLPLGYIVLMAFLFSKIKQKRRSYGIVEYHTHRIW